MESPKTLNYKEFTISNINQWEFTDLYKDSSKCYNDTVASFKFCEDEIKKKSRYMIKFMSWFKITEPRSDFYLYEIASIAIDNYGNFVTYYASDPKKFLYQRSKPIFDGYTFDSDNVILQNPLIDIVLATNLPKINIGNTYDDTLNDSLADNIPDLKSFLKQLQITAKTIKNSL